jgi:hypothetical protein
MQSVRVHSQEDLQTLNLLKLLTSSRLGVESSKVGTCMSKFDSVCREGRVDPLVCISSVIVVIQKQLIVIEVVTVVTRLHFVFSKSAEAL